VVISAADGLDEVALARSHNLAAAGVAGGNVPLKNEPDAYLLPLGCGALAPTLYGTSSSTSLVVASSRRVGVGTPP
jgi:hypothetical protein